MSLKCILVSSCQTCPYCIHPMLAEPLPLLPMCEDYEYRQIDTYPIIPDWCNLAECECKGGQECCNTK